MRIAEKIQTQFHAEETVLNPVPNDCWYQKYQNCHGLPLHKDIFI